MGAETDAACRPVSVSEGDRVDSCGSRNALHPFFASPPGQNSPLPETVVFSDFVVKINRKEKEQTRVILLTNKAVYNLLPSAYGKCKRRIAIESIASITASSISDEFVLHVPEEYDYRFKSAKKDKVCELLVKLFKKLWEKEEKAAQLAAGPNGKIKKKRIREFLSVLTHGSLEPVVRSFGDCSC